MQTVLIPTPNNDDLELRLRAIADTLEVPGSAYTEATARYESVGRWLCADGSPLKEFNPQVFAQGSFALGTVIRPYNRQDYDIDAVVQLDGTVSTWAPRRLKIALGDRLGASATYAKMLAPEGRRCWTLAYASGENEVGFHMDLLVCVSHEVASDLLGVAGTPTAIAITNRIVPEMYEWRQSDPKGYASWFRKRMVQRRPRELSEKRASIEAVPAYSTRSTLQVTVQLLKRHRDVLFQGREEAPISVIISTLAARAYDGEPSLAETVVNVTKGMRKYIEVVDGRPFIRNPVRPEENFADRWEIEPAKQVAFFEWLSAVEQLVDDVAQAPENDLEGLLSVSFGESIARGAVKKYASRRGGIVRALVDPRGVVSAPAAPQPTPTPGPRLMPSGAVLPAAWASAPQRKEVGWPERPDGTRLRLTARVTGGRGVRIGPLSSGQLLSPESKLRFEAVGEQRAGDEVHWQIVNTGRHAEHRGQLRGSFELGSGDAKVETALYPGDHFIEAFLVRRGACVARSGPFTVRVG